MAGRGAEGRGAEGRGTEGKGAQGWGEGARDARVPKWSPLTGLGEVVRPMAQHAGGQGGGRGGWGGRGGGSRVGGEEGGLRGGSSGSLLREAKTAAFGLCLASCRDVCPRARGSTFGSRAWG